MKPTPSPSTRKESLNTSSAENAVENYVDNSWKSFENPFCHLRHVYSRQVFLQLFETFPLFFAEKRYKLCNFAPELENVDNHTILFVFNEKQFTLYVYNMKLTKE